MRKQIEAIVKETYSVCHIVKFSCPSNTTQDEIDAHAIELARKQSTIEHITLFDIITWKEK